MKIEHLKNALTVEQAQSLKHIFSRHIVPAKAGPFAGLSVNDWLDYYVSPSVFGDTVWAVVPDMTICILEDGSHDT